MKITHVSNVTAAQTAVGLGGDWPTRRALFVEHLKQAHGVNKSISNFATNEVGVFRLAVWIENYCVKQEEPTSQCSGWAILLRQIETAGDMEPAREEKGIAHPVVEPAEFTRQEPGAELHVYFVGHRGHPRVFPVHPTKGWKLSNNGDATIQAFEWESQGRQQPFTLIPARNIAWLEVHPR